MCGSLCELGSMVEREGKGVRDMRGDFREGGLGRSERRTLFVMLATALFRTDNRNECVCVCVVLDVVVDVVHVENLPAVCLRVIEMRCAIMPRNCENLHIYICLASREHVCELGCVFSAYMMLLRLLIGV